MFGRSSHCLVRLAEGALKVIFFFGLAASPREMSLGTDFGTRTRMLGE
jgi:hypothetical protein